MSLSFSTAKSMPCNVDFNIGIALYPEDTTDPESLVKAADMALEDIRSSINNKWCFYSKAMSYANQQRLSMEVMLKQALEEKQFEVFLQPIINTETEKVIKAEALLRWTTPNGETISPSDFIPIAEADGLIIPLGNWVINTVCNILVLLTEQNIDITLSINLSPKQVNDRYLLEFIKTTIKQTHVNAHNLELELTEGVLINAYTQTSSLLNSLREMGVSIAIDDFGTGYSSLSYLKHLPIDYLKIDRSFIRDLNSNENDQAIVLAIIAMAKQLRLSVIAEGVETLSQKEFLKRNYCNSIQGYYYSKPLPINDFIQFVKRQNEI